MEVEKIGLTPSKTKRAQKHEGIRRSVLGMADDEVWNRKSEKGFCTIPRTLPLIMTLLQMLSKKHDPSRVYLELWGRAFDEGIVDVTDEAALAYASGYITPGRSVRTWRERIEVLEKLGFIKTSTCGPTKYKYIFLRHPHQVVARLRKAHKIADQWYTAFQTRMFEIGGEMPNSDKEE